MKITVFTPTYNRAKLLSRLYESLCHQTSSDFEWIIVDDGSTDETENVCKSFKSEAFSITYYKVENRGKYIAVNFAANKAKGEWFFIVDSDDWLPQDSIQKIIDEEKNIVSSNVGVLCGMRSFNNGCRVGGDADFKCVECTPFLFRYKMNVKGDLAEIVRTSIMRRFKFPEYDGEKFCPEALLFNRIGQKYLTHYFNDNIYYCEYQPNGLSANIVKIRKGSWRLTTMCYAEQAKCPVPFIIKLRSWINFWRFLFCGEKKERNIKSFDLPMLAYLCIPIGWVMFIKDKKVR